MQDDRVGIDAFAVARLIVDRLMRERRVLPSAPREPTDAARAQHIARVLRFVDASEPIELVLPAFPAKAPNAAKVLGSLPDAAELVALRALDALLADLGELHPPGATLVLCSDGHVFADVVGVSDASVAAYRDGLHAMIDAIDAPRIRLFDLTDAYGEETSPLNARRRLFTDHAVSIDDIRRRAAASSARRAQLDGIHRFMFEDEIARTRDDPRRPSRTQIRRRARALAYEVVRRSEAWGSLVACAFPRAIRLSIHPQPDVSSKIGIALVPAADVWLTPWHGVLVVDAPPNAGGRRARLMRRHEAEALGATVVEENGRPQYMELRA